MGLGTWRKSQRAFRCSRTELISPSLCMSVWGKENREKYREREREEGGRERKRRRERERERERGGSSASEQHQGGYTADHAVSERIPITSSDTSASMMSS